MTIQISDGSSTTAINVLVCDDDMGIARAISMKLTRCGYNVVTCYDGFSGMEAFERSPTDLIVTDCQMPNMTGIELGRMVRRAGHRIPIILLTAKSLELDSQMLDDEIGNIRLYEKPFSPRELATAVGEALTQVQQPEPISV